jgi:hypothetical protein
MIRDLVRHRGGGEPRQQEMIELLTGWRAQTVGALLDDLLAGRREIRIGRHGREMTIQVT